jgi:DNA modification methylase
MVEMWDEAFAGLDPETSALLAAGDGRGAFERMHRVLDDAWKEVRRVLIPGGICCVNVGDATRTVGGQFSLYPNASRIVSTFLSLGFDVLPRILWRKSTNAPNKFMGSGMLPASAYVTLEHEYVLVFRNGGKREFSADRSIRRRSAYFWEERNRWFSDLWTDVGAVGQNLAAGSGRARSGAFPFELPYRLVHMYSIQGDLVLDPFVGTGSTILAAVAGARNSVGVDIDESLLALCASRIEQEWRAAARRTERRFNDHATFVWDREAKGKPAAHRNAVGGYPVVTAQETDIDLPTVTGIEADGRTFAATHGSLPWPELT